ncbi:MAG: hypothetical protein AAF696_33590 [Bacteroidota bacterium]
MKNKSLKASTLLLFISLIATFVIYSSKQSDSQRASYATSPNGGSFTNQGDSLSKKELKKRRKIMSSSKSVGLTDKGNIFTKIFPFLKPKKTGVKYSEDTYDPEAWKNKGKEKRKKKN